MLRRCIPILLLAVTGVCQAQPTTLRYYLAHIAAADVWRTTFTYINGTTQPVTCKTAFFSDSGSSLSLTFNGATATTTTDDIPAGGVARRQTDAQPGAPVVTGWAVADCTGPVKASSLFRRFDGTIPQAEASVLAMTAPATQFVTYADQFTGVAYANPSATAASVTFTAKAADGTALATKSLTLAPSAHGAQNVGPLLGLSSLQGSITISSSTPIVSLSLNAEASPIFSSLPPGQIDSGPGPATYYFAHIAAADVWRTTFTYINTGTTAVTCNTSFFSDAGAPLSLTFSGKAVSSTSDNIPAGGTARRQTDAQPGAPALTGWAVANCSGQVKASALFREYSGTTPVAEASVLASTHPASQFVTYADQSTGVAYANPTVNPAKVTFTAENTAGAVVATTSLTLPPNAHGSANLGPLLGIGSFQGSITITSLQPIISLSLNAEAAPIYSALPAGDGGSFEVYGVWHCSNDACTWKTVRTITDFDTENHWIIDRGDGSGLPSVNLVVLSFVQPTKLVNLTNDSQTVNGIPVGMTAAIINYFTSHNVRVMLSLGGSTFTSDWDQAISTNASATQLGLNAANAAKAMGVGFEIDYENDTNPNLTGMQQFITAYRSVAPYDPAGTNPAARLTIDLAAGDHSLVALCRKVASDWLTGTSPILDYANATVPNGQPLPADAETNWQQHVDGRPTLSPPIATLAPSRFTVAVRLVLGSTPEPECNNFSMSLQNSTGIFVQGVAPNGAGVTPGTLGYMFWGAAAQRPATCEKGIGTGAKNYSINIPMPPLTRQ